MDYDKTREECLRRKQEVTGRLSKIWEERNLLQTELETLQRELAGIEHILEGVDVVTSDEPLASEPKGMGDHIRHLLQETPVHLLPTQIRDSLISVGVTGSSPKNLLIGVHNVLSRLDRFLDTTEINNRTAYRWKREANSAAKVGSSGHDKSKVPGTPKHK
jgi:hypothetical protein